MKLKQWPQFRDTTWLLDLVEEEAAVENWRPVFEKAYLQEGSVPYWDYQWSFACWANSGLSIWPKSNLISNIGFCADGTHTLDPRDARSNVPTVGLSFPLQHPPNVLRSMQTDRRVIQELVLAEVRPPPPAPSAYQKMRSALSSTLPAPVRRTLRRAFGRA
jgi:hypothetical protein